MKNLIATLIVASCVLPGQSLADGAPTNTEFENMEFSRRAAEDFARNLIECSGGGTSINLDGNIEGSITGIFDSEGTAGRAEMRLDSFLQIFPEEDRLAAYAIYTDCLQGLYPTVDGALVISTETNTTPYLDVEGRQRATVEAEFSDQIREIVTLVGGELNCQMVIIPPDNARLPFVVSILEERNDASFHEHASVSIMPNGETFGDNSTGVLLSKPYHVSVRSLSGNGTVSFMIGKRC